MNVNENSPMVSNFYEQMMLQRNLAVLQQHQQAQNQIHQLHLQIQSNTFKSNTTSSSSAPSSSSSSSSSTSSLLSISSKSQQPSPNNSLLSPIQIESPDVKNRPSNFNQANEYENSYRAYMMNAAAAAAASAFPYSMFNLPNATNSSQISNLSSNLQTLHQSTNSYQFPLANPNPQSQYIIENFQGLFAAAVTASASQKANQIQNKNYQSQHQQQHRHHHTNSNQNIYKPNGKSEEAKPTHSYIGLIALAILSTPEKRLVLSDIYQWILDNYTYFHTRGSGWRNSIRHNLSLNDCFMKSGRSSNGKGHYWTIHPANLEDFSKGDFRRRRAQRRVRKSLGLTVPEEDEEDEDILTPPSSLSPIHQKAYNNNNLSSNSSCSSTNSGVILSNNFNERKPVNDCYSFELNGLNMKRHLQNDDDLEQSKKHAKHDYANEMFGFNCKTVFDKNEKSDLSDLDTSSEENSELTADTEEIDIITLLNKKNSSHLDHDLSRASCSKKRSFNVDSLLAPDTDSNVEDESHHEVGFKKLKADENEEIINLNKSDISKPRHENETLNDTNETSHLRDSSFSLDSSKNYPYQADLNLNEYNHENYKNAKKNDQEEEPNSNNEAIKTLKPSPNKSQCNQRQLASNPNKALNTHRHGTKSAHFSNSLNDDQNFNSPFSKLESNNQDVEKWKQTFSKIMARSYKNGNSQSHPASNLTQRKH